MSVQQRRVPIDPDGSHGSSYLTTKQSWMEEDTIDDQPVALDETEQPHEEVLEREIEEPMTMTMVDPTHQFEEPAEVGAAVDVDELAGELADNEVKDQKEIASTFDFKTEAEIMDRAINESTKTEEMLSTHSNLDLVGAIEGATDNDKSNGYAQIFDVEEGQTEKFDISNDENATKGKTDVSYKETKPPKEGVGFFEAWIRDGHRTHTMLYLCVMIMPWIPPGEVFIIFWFMFYIFFLLEYRLWSSTRKYLKNVNTTESLIDYLGRLHKTAPTLSLSISCYHYETRTRTRTSTDSNGRTVYTTETYQEMVVTYTERENVNIISWEDISPQITNDDVAEYQATKVVLHNTFVADDDYHRQEAALIARNRHRDVHYSLHVNYNVAGHKDRLLSYVDLNKKPYMLHSFWAWCFHITVVFALPFRLWMGSVTGKIETRIHKSLKTSWGASLPAAGEEQRASASGPEKVAPKQEEASFQDSTLRTESSFSERVGDTCPQVSEVFEA